MDKPFAITEDHLGWFATEADACEMARMLTAMGYPTVYGSEGASPEAIPEEVWQDALDCIGLWPTDIGRGGV